MCYRCELCMLYGSCVPWLYRIESGTTTRSKSILTREVHDVGNVSLTLYGCYQSESAPNNVVMVSCNADDTDIGGWRIVFDWKSILTRELAGNEDMSWINAPVNDSPTAPQPVSPKLATILCLRAPHICFSSKLLVGWPADCFGLPNETGMNSTRSQRF